MTTQLESKIDDLRSHTYRAHIDYLERLGDLEKSVRSLSDTVLRSAPPQLMTTQEAATYLQMSEMRLYQLRKQGGGPRFLQPTERIVRYRLVDLEAWLDQQGK